MIGNYYMADEETILKIREGTLSVGDLIYDENADEDRFLEIDKAWHAIHFTLTGETDESDTNNFLSKLVFSGNPVSDEDVGYGSAMEITADEVKRIHLSIRDITKSDFHHEFNVQKMAKNDIYPVTEDEDENEFFEYVWQYFELLNSFFARASQNANCILFYIN